MPELPDVEYFSKYFNRTSLDKEILNVSSSSRELIKNVSFKKFKKELVGKKFKHSERKGKFLVAGIIGSEQKLLLHFGMTGSLKYIKKENASPENEELKFSRLFFSFSNGYNLHWLNMRKLGKVYLTANMASIKSIRDMGPDAMEITKKDFFNILKNNSRKSSKSFLMTQSTLAGIGNIYSDEILFKSGILPKRKINSLKGNEKEKLFKNTKTVLKEAIKRQPGRRNFENSWLFMHRGDMKCPNNRNHSLKRKRISGRSAYFCPQCQK